VEFWAQTCVDINIPLDGEGRCLRPAAELSLATSLTRLRFSLAYTDAVLPLLTALERLKIPFAFFLGVVLLAISLQTVLTVRPHVKVQLHPMGIVVDAGSGESVGTRARASKSDGLLLLGSFGAIMLRLCVTLYVTAQWL